MNSKIAWSMIVYSIGFILLADSYQIIPNSYYFERAKTDLLNLIESVRVGRDLPMIAGIVRLAFHDCIGKGKCNGCLDHSLPNNRGLKKVTDRLDTLYDASYKGKMSRADFYALSAVIALTRSTSSVRNKYNGIKTFKVGRKDCNTSPVELQSNSEFPRGSDGTSKTLGFFKQEFGFNTREAVAILGAHTLGRCKTQNSGFVGAWVDSRFSTALPGEALAPTSILDNAYYRMIVDVVQWDQVNINGTRIQWQEQNRPIPNDKLQESRRSPLLLNSDMSISWIITPTENIGTVSCTPTSQSNPCLHSNAHTYAKLYAHNNAFWVQEFTRVFNKMISRSDYKLRKSPTPITNTFYIQKPLYNDEEMFDGIDEDEF